MGRKGKKGVGNGKESRKKGKGEGKGEEKKQRRLKHKGLTDWFLAQEQNMTSEKISIFCSSCGFFCHLCPAYRSNSWIWPVKEILKHPTAHREAGREMSKR